MTSRPKLPDNTIQTGDCRSIMRAWAKDGVKAQMCVTSPPYWGLRDYKADGESLAGQWGQEKTIEEHIARLVACFREVRRVLRDDGTLFLNYGDSYWGGRSYDISGKQPVNYPGGDLFLNDLCDGCREVLIPRKSHKGSPPSLGSDGDEADQNQGSKAKRDLSFENSGSEDQKHFEQSDRARLDQKLSPDHVGASTLSVRASTTAQSLPQPPGACLHCRNCGGCLSVLR